MAWEVQQPVMFLRLEPTQAVLVGHCDWYCQSDHWQQGPAVPGPPSLYQAGTPVPVRQSEGTSVVLTPLPVGKLTCKVFPNYPCSRQGRAVTPCMAISQGYTRVTILRPLKKDSWSSMQLQYPPCLN
eukprot:1428294-Rhodomonas_salina.1